MCSNKTQQNLEKTPYTTFFNPRNPNGKTNIRLEILIALEVKYKGASYALRLCIVTH